MNKNILIYLILATFLKSTGGLAQESSSIERFISHGSSCKASDPALSVKLQSKESGLTNTHETLSLTVVCPLKRRSFSEASNSNDTAFRARIILGNSSETTQSVNCQLQELLGPKVENEWSALISIAADVTQSNEYTWDVVAASSPDLSLMNISCDLPPGISLINVHTESSDQTPFDSSNLPQISTFQSKPSDQFIVDLNVVNNGHIYRGKDANNPHSGAHVQFKEVYFDNYAESGELSDLPKIYAAFDGVITGVDYYFAQSTGNYRYGYLIEFAKSDGRNVRFNYSIEPMLDPKDEDFYRKFLLKKQGDVVRKGDLIAYMYSSTGDEYINGVCGFKANCTPASNAHIHYDIAKNGGGFMSPSIFNDSIMLQLSGQLRGGNVHKDCGGPCGPEEYIEYTECADSGGMGYKLKSEENPFEDKAADCL